MSLSQRIALLGAGNLGGALIQGLLDAGTSSPDRLSIADASASRVEELRAKHGLLLAATNNREAAAAADVIVIAVKPHIVADVVSDLAEDLRPDQLLISFAAAVPLRRIEAGLNAPAPVIRAMPNIAMTAHASATALCGNDEASEDHMALAAEIFGSVGETVFVSEDQMHAVTGLSGSGPAYVFTMIEALAAGGIKMGLPAAVARRLAAQTLFGAAKMALASDKHPAELRDMVTTPGGTTIAGLHEMELQGLRGALASAVEAATERSRELAAMLDDED